MANGCTAESHFSCSLCEQLTVGLDFIRQAEISEFEAPPATSALPLGIWESVSSAEGKGRSLSPPLFVTNVFKESTSSLDVYTIHMFPKDRIVRFRNQLWPALTQQRLSEPFKQRRAGEQGVRIKALPERRKRNSVGQGAPSSRQPPPPYFGSFFVSLIQIYISVSEAIYT